MAINIDTVYQRVLALASKEQRGYINPQQFNLFANQSQFDIFEDYFFKLAGLEFSQKNNSQYNDMKKLLNEKIQPFEKRHQAVEVTSRYNHYLPEDIYRLGEVMWYGSTVFPNTKIIEEVTEKELIESLNTPLAKYNQSRPVFVRRDTSLSDIASRLITIYPNSDDPAKQVALYFTQEGDTSTDTTPDLDTGGNLAFVEVGQTVTGTDIPDNTTVTVINNTTGAMTMSNAATSGLAVTFTFASDDIVCNYIRRPEAVSWGYTEVNSVALYNSASSTDFELHESEENTLVIKILALAGISIKNPELMQVAMAKEAQTK